MRFSRLLVAMLTVSVLFGLMPAFASAARIESVVFTDANNGYFAGGYSSASVDRVGFVSRTTDGGVSWKPWKSNYRWMYGVDALSATSVWAVSDFSNYSWRSTTGGTTWLQTGAIGAMPTDANAYGVAMTEASAATVAGIQGDTSEGALATVWRTIDTGGSWTPAWSGPVYADPLVDTEAQFDAVDAAPDHQTVYAVGRFATLTDKGGTTGIVKSVQSPLMIKSTNGGASWSRVTLPANAYAKFFMDVSAGSSTNAWAVGGTKVARTTDGTNWTWLATSPITSPNGVDARGTSRVAIVGEGGRVAVSVNGGSTWKTWTVPAPYTLSLYDVAFRDDAHLVAVGKDEVVVRMTLAADGAISGSATKAIGGAVATPVSTSVTLSAPSISAYASAKLSGYLKYGSGSALKSKPVVIEQYVGSGVWKQLATVTSSATTGYFSYTAKPTVKTTYRARFLAAGGYLGSYSANRTVLPMVRLTATSSWSTLTYNKTYTATGSIEPRHYSTSGKVYLYAYQRASNGSYVYKRRYTATYYTLASDPSTKTRYKAAVKLPYKGTWRIRAYHAADSSNAATWGSFDYFTVK